MLRPMTRPAFPLFYLLPLFMIACSKPPEPTATIPKESGWVAVYDVEAIAKKGKLTEPKQYQSFRMIKGEMKSQPKGIRKLFESFLNNPLSLGIDLSKDLYTFYYPKGKSGLVGMAASMADRSKFKKNLKEIIKVGGSQKDGKIKKKKGRSYRALDDGVIAWDDGRVLYLVHLHKTDGKIAMKEAQKLLEADKKNSLMATNDDFKRFMEQRKDISNWIAMDRLPADFNRTIASLKRKIDHLSMQSEKVIKGTTMHSYLAFKKNSISFTHFTRNSEWGASKKFQKVMKEGLDPKLLNYAPKDPYMGAALAFDPGAAYGILKEEGKTKAFTRAEKELEQEQGIDLQKLIKSLSGDMMVTVNDFSTYRATVYDRVRKKNGKGGFSGLQFKSVEKKKAFPYPQFALLLKTRSSYLKDQLKKKLIPLDSVKATGDYYTVDIMDFPLFLGWKEEKMILGSHEKALKKFFQGGYSSSSLADSDMGSLFKGSSASASMKLSFDQYPKVVRDYLTEDLGRPTKDAFKKAFKTFERIEAKSIEKNGVRVTLQLKKGKGNSLYRILKKADRSTGSLMRAL